jgi:hypothetical protein
MLFVFYVLSDLVSLRWCAFDFNHTWDRTIHVTSIASGHQQNGDRHRRRQAKTETGTADGASPRFRLLAH